MDCNWIALAIAILNPKTIGVKTALIKAGYNRHVKKATKDTAK